MWRRNTVFWGLIFFIVGVLIWLSNLEIIGLSWKRDWPIILIVIGIYKLVTLLPRKKKKGPTKGVTDILESIERGKITANEGLKEMKERGVSYE